MSKKIFLAFFLIFALIGIIYPTKKEKTKSLDYCHSLEKILSRNSFQKRKNVSKKFLSLSKDLANVGINKSRGELIKKIIDQYKSSKNLFIVDIIPNEFFCLAGYWTEKFNPGLIESIIYEKTKMKINEFKDTQKELDELFKDIKTDYNIFREELNNLF